MRYFLAVSLGKSLRYALRLIRRGGGSALPGLIVSKLAPGLLTSALRDLPTGVVVVSGSAGKSSTTQTIVRMLEGSGLKVFTNPSTANIAQGYYSAILAESSLLGKLDYDIAVLEVDEGHGVLLAAKVKPRLAVLTNVLSDQLDRFVDPRNVINMLQQILNNSSAAVINADDPNLNQLSLPTSTKAVGLVDALLKSKDAPRYAFNFREPVDIERTALASQSSIDFMGNDYPSSSSSPEHLLNDALALVAANQIVDVPVEVAREVLSNEGRVFARNEVVSVEDRKIRIRLVQNPTSFQLNLDELDGNEAPLMLMAGSDIHDPSWLWTVDFSRLKKVDIVAGSNAYDLALRLSYAGVDVAEVIAEPHSAGDRFLALPGKVPTVLFSADAMRRLRRHWGLAK